MRRTIVVIVGIAVVGFIVLQVLPVGNWIPRLRHPGNPPAGQAVQWDSAETESIVRRACYDCHSHETEWPWYSNIAPVSWLVFYDINGGRAEVNFSDMQPDEAEDLAEDIEDVISDGEMPLPIYLLMHSDARLTDAEKQTLIDGAARTFGATDHEDRSDADD